MTGEFKNDPEFTFKLTLGGETLTDSSDNWSTTMTASNWKADWS